MNSVGTNRAASMKLLARNKNAASTAHAGGLYAGRTLRHAQQSGQVAAAMQASFLIQNCKRLQGQFDERVAR